MDTGITVKLLRDGQEFGKSVTLNPDNNWTAIVKNLDAVHLVGDELKEYTYSWSEPAVTGYDKVDTTKLVEVNLTNVEDGKATLSTLTNSYTPETIKISVQKVWKDNDNKTNRRTPSVTVQLYADGQAVEGKTAVLNEGNGWKAEWTDLPKCRNTSNPNELAKVNEIEYTVAELDVPNDYECEITGKVTDYGLSFTVTNTFDSGKMLIEKEIDIEPWEPFGPDESPRDIPVIKTWNDNNNKDGNRPESITVRLLADGVEIANRTLTEKDDWKTVFTGLDRFKEVTDEQTGKTEKKEIVYTITEDPVEWYKTEINGFNIRNNYEPELTSVTVKKNWVDNNDALRQRPLSITMTLSNGMSVVLNAGNNWTATIRNLPTRVNGKPVTYTWKEQAVLNYDKTGETTENGVTTFTNTVWQRKDTPKNGAKPKTAGKEKEQLEDYETPLGVDVMINHVGDCFD